MKKREIEDPYRIQRLLAYMDFATKLKIAQEDNKKKRNTNRNKESNK